MMARVAFVAACFATVMADTISSNSVTATMSITSNWGSGYCGSINVKNGGTTTVSSWTLVLNLKQSAISGLWGASLSGSTVTGLSYNAQLSAGATVDIGFCGTASGTDYLPVLSSLTTATTTPQPSTSSSCSKTCSWYGTAYPICTTTTSGWGWENSKTCLAESTCVSQLGSSALTSSCSGSTPASTPTPTTKATPAPTTKATPAPTTKATPAPTTKATPAPTTKATPVPTTKATPAPTPTPTTKATPAPTPTPTTKATPAPTPAPTTKATPAPASTQIPNAASNGFPYCRSSDSDPDGDGWGWENAYSCVVYRSAADGGVGSYAYCVIGSAKITLCATDTGSWGNENSAVCLSKSMCPGMGSATQGAMRSGLVNSAATSSAKAVYAYLKSVWGSKMIAGQMDQTWQNAIDQYQRCIDDTGKAPALMGYDFMNYGLYWDGISGLTQTEEAITHWNRGGLVAFNWHWRDPNAASGVVGDFYSDKTTFSIPIVNGKLDTTSTSYTNIMSDIEMIATELKKLQAAGVAVLWRPLHEASGGWFWWGRTRTDSVPPAYACAVLWKHLYTTLTTTYGINNLVWVWNGQSAAWYPGDDYVDIVSYDIYDGAQNYESQIDTYKLTASFPHEVKIVALSENSNIPDPDKMKADGAWWSWFMVWNDVDTAAHVKNDGNFWTGEYFNTDAHKKYVYTHSLVVTLDELPSFK